MCSKVIPLPDWTSPLSNAPSSATTWPPPSPVHSHVTVVPEATRIVGGANAKFPPLPLAPTCTVAEP
jgi:hypothetical protein